MKCDACYIKVALPIAVDSLFTYKLAACKDESLIGRRVLVSFNSKNLTGVIIDFDNAPAADYIIKEVLDLIDAEPIFSQQMLKFAKWVSEYYMCSLGETLKAALPQAMNPKSIIRVEIARQLSDAEIDEVFARAPKQKEIYMFLKDRGSAISSDYIQKSLKHKSIISSLASLESRGLISSKQLSETHAKPKTAKAIRLSEEFFTNEENIAKFLNKHEKKSPKKAKFLIQLYEYFENDIYEIWLSDAKKLFSSQIIKWFKESEIIEIFDKEIDRYSEIENGNSLAKKNELELPLTAEQKSAVEVINTSIDADNFKPYLLFGVTGSGKTLVYLHTIEHTLRHGKSALLLVPEISLTPQLIDRFAKVFGGEIAVFHSKMSEGERFDAFRSTQSGKAKIVIGARSALFAPLKNLGLIIVDEEHEPSYKQESPNPRYNGRDAAVMRGYYENAIVVLGSATPSFETYYNAMNNRYQMLEISQRADGAQMPVIKVVDTIAAAKSGQMRGSFSKSLFDAIVDRLAKKEGVILFQNRRGFSSYLECPDCGEIPTCKNCSVTLVYHRTTNELRCHYCGYASKAHYGCHRCGFPNMREVGSGTQRIEDELAEYLDMQEVDFTIERMDLDTTSLKGSHRAMLERFSSGQTDILVGTQMVAKGLDFDRVTLVGVLNADLQLFLPDFRASERTFQLLSQVAGRAGRSSALTGEVIIQTAHPNNPAILKVIENNYSGFFAEENIFRKSALYPPYSRFCLIEFTSENPKNVESSSRDFAKFIPHYQHFIILGPIVPTIEKIRGKHRRIIIIKNLKELDPNGGYLRYAIKAASEKYSKESYPDVRYTIDIDTFSGL